MQNFKTLNIAVGGLKEGEHRFEYKINELYFEESGYFEIKKGNFNVKVDLLKQLNLLTLNFSINGVATVICDRCLEELEIPVECNQRLFVSFGEHTHEQTDEIFVLARNEQELALWQFIYEYIILSLPIIRSHPEGQCDPEQEKKIEELKPRDNHSDPRWDALKNLQ